ncbi:hypothetical protein GCM10007147_37720 [Nocardiopsis kunsanensis]|uniref:Uncharacterized protein n=1 Tax=Nocardiopsis kunsanensis TaxID=141693 RepID=A0A918XJ66_9ACTN|nr:hypothetical protein GCM10007147_37720 [Nocardiopsis kunsanensis]
MNRLFIITHPGLTSTPVSTHRLNAHQNRKAVNNDMTEAGARLSINLSLPAADGTPKDTVITAKKIATIEVVTIETNRP